MSGWRDTGGRTRDERQRRARADERAQLIDRAKRQPMWVLRTALAAASIALLIAALLLR
jgi:hypothetical protein